MPLAGITGAGPPVWPCFRAPVMALARPTLVFALSATSSSILLPSAPMVPAAAAASPLASASPHWPSTQTSSSLAAAGAGGAGAGVAWGAGWWWAGAGGAGLGGDCAGAGAGGGAALGLGATGVGVSSPPQHDRELPSFGSGRWGAGPSRLDDGVRGARLDESVEGGWGGGLSLGGVGRDTSGACRPAGVRLAVKLGAVHRA